MIFSGTKHATYGKTITSNTRHKRYLPTTSDEVIKPWSAVSTRRGKRYTRLTYLSRTGRSTYLMRNQHYFSARNQIRPSRSVILRSRGLFLCPPHSCAILFRVPERPRRENPSSHHQGRIHALCFWISIVVGVVRFYLVPNTKQISTDVTHIVSSNPFSQTLTQTSLALLVLAAGSLNWTRTRGF